MSDGSAGYAFYSIGHSTRPLPEFISLLQEAGVGTLADIRSVPRSRAQPQFNTDVLADTLARAGIAYHYVRSLGGLRKKSRNVPSELNGYWRNQSFHNYADFALGEEFHTGLTRLRALGRTAPCAFMCAEAVWWRCHRRIVADYLVAAGETVFHIMGHHQIEPVTLTPAARRREDGTLIYPDGGQSQPA